MINMTTSETTKSSSESENKYVNHNRLETHEFNHLSPTPNVSENLFNEEIDDLICEVGDTVTIKFKTNEGESFTKAFKRSATIGSIKIELSTLFSIPTNRITIENDHKILSDDVILTHLGVEALGTFELELKIGKPYSLNRDLIYGHIPNIDVIVVRANGYDLIVEIENQCNEKEWLGGYKNKITNKYYHHGCTQTSDQRRRKISTSTQKSYVRDSGTNTPKTTTTQTTSIPSITDTIIKAGNYKPFTEKRKTKCPKPTAPEKVQIMPAPHVESPPQNSENKFFAIATQLRTLRREIKKWNWAENEKLKDCDEKRRRVRRTEILNRTRMILLRIGREKRQLLQQACLKNEEKILSTAAEPKLFVTKTGEKVKIDTLNCQQARELQKLYNEYINEEASSEAKMRSMVNLQTFFAHRKNFEFSKHVVDLLQRDLDILTYRLECIPSLEARIERFVFYYLQLSNVENAVKSKSVHINTFTQNIQQYRAILVRLQNDEMNRFRCFTSVAFQMDMSDIQHLVSTIWKDCSALNECPDMDQLRLTRWQKNIEWSPWNCILLSKHELKSHLEANDLEEKYDKCFRSKIRNKHLQAKIYFHEISTFHEWFRQTE